MVFNSWEFASYFSVLFLLYWLLRNFRSVQNILLVIGSFYLYSLFHYSFPIYLFSLIVISYLSGYAVSKTENITAKRLLLYCSLFILGIGLLYLKYSGLIIGNIQGLSSWQASALKLLVPLGISYYTFSTIGYVIDVYFKKIEPEKNFLIFTTYVSFYPYLLIGPIPSAQTILPQFKVRSRLSLEDFDQSAGEILWGLFKKIVVSGNIMLGISYCFKRHNELSGSTILIGSILFTISLYADFSGYSDMARGLSRLLGINIIKNFNNPFLSKSITELWRRWHISLSSWLNEYLFNPMISSLRNWGKGAIVFSLIATFVICGFWHGADWKYVIFGLMQGIAIAAEYLTRKRRRAILGVLPNWLNNIISILLTFIYFSISLIFFKADSVKEANEMISSIFSKSLFTLPEVFELKYLKWCLPLIIIEFIQSNGSYTFDLQQWGLTQSPDKANKKYIYSIVLKIILYSLLGIAIWYFYKRQNMAEYYYFKF